MSTDKILKAILDEDLRIAADATRESLYSRAASVIAEKKKSADELLFNKTQELSDAVMKMKEAELSPEQKAFRELFQKMLDKYEVDSPNELSDQKKKEFFSEVGFEWSKHPENDTSGEGED